MAAGPRAEALLAQLKDELISEGQTKDEVEAGLPAQVLAEHAVSTRKTHKLMYTQLQMVKFLLDFLDSAPCIQDASDTAVRKEMVEAKQQWKTLKAEYQQLVELIKGAVPYILAKLEEGENRAQLLESALQRYQAKKREMEEKKKSACCRLQKEQERLCERQQQLERIFNFRSHLETLQGVKLISVSEADLEIELTSCSQPVTSDSHHLKLHIHWADDGTVTLQTDSPFFLVSVVLPVGTCNTIRGIILELQHSYSQQAHLMAEIESLQSCFAIDWQQEKRLLSYLKPSSTCNLYVEPGYPDSGGICLLSVKNQHGTVDVTSYRVLISFQWVTAALFGRATELSWDEEPDVQPHGGAVVAHLFVRYCLL
ncbi:hypothetical protein JD844_010527 [Phrynosoma platyrhinos]|uniref:ZW10 interactor n=1 Tax=Phrynosoma platyrhinos TaxID=52577 RepID=A0ABQ7TGL9_PHRPL|nr:hypothetical protein JD844_010527 [Phrynosoma platyrhinos]